ncbi:Crp/Fnr family transcriptional regulator [Flavobacterium sp. LT1R49]|uniref:Crp/Fnr family transcriptional regulator n=1 Tax=Flavobacterium arabinosi TaxID=3398737 RepID=UPI003A8558CA
MDHLETFFSSIANIDEDNFTLSVPMWQEKKYRKGEFYNEYRNVCKYLGVIKKGVFRTYYVDDKTGEEKNIFFYSNNQFVVAYKSFISQTPCNYFTQAMTDATIYYIHIEQLNKLYSQSHQWEHLGRIIAERAFSVGNDRMESFLFRTAEERYLDLIEQHPDIFNAIPLYHIASYLGIQGPSLSRIRKRMTHQ